MGFQLSSLEKDEGGTRVLGIIAGILVGRHLKTTDDLFDNRSSPRTESLVAAAVRWAEKDHAEGGQLSREEANVASVIDYFRQLTTPCALYAETSTVPTSSFCQ